MKSSDVGNQVILQELKKLTVKVSEMEVNMATKQELKSLTAKVTGMESNIATKQELTGIRQELMEVRGSVATKQEMRALSAKVGNIETSLITKEYVDKQFKEMKKEFKGMKGWIVNLATTSPTINSFYELESRVKKLEGYAGVAGA